MRGPIVTTRMTATGSRALSRMTIHSDSPIRMGGHGGVQSRTGPSGGRGRSTGRSAGGSVRNRARGSSGGRTPVLEGAGGVGRDRG